MFSDPEFIMMCITISAVINLVILVWFIMTMIKIRASIEDIAEYTRRTALSTKLTQGQVKLLNNSYSTQELITAIEKNGGILKLEEKTIGEQTKLFLRVENSFHVDPEWIKQIMKREHDVIRILQVEKYQN